MLYFDTSYIGLYDPRPMSRDLPATVDAIRLADAGARLTGELPLAAMMRLQGLCLRGGGVAEVDLHFERGGERGLRRMHGTITARVHVACQRCLEELTLVLTAKTSLLLVRPGERPDLADEGAELLVADAPVSLSDIVEDELLLAMPMIPKHEPSMCTGAPGQRGQAADTAQSPFAALSRLKQERK